jgi:50S ribosomal protein uL3
MSPGILGKKIGMTQMFRPDGQAVPVTLLKAGPCMVVQRKTPTVDGYDAVQLGLVEFIKPQRINKPTTGRLKKAGVDGAKFMREFRLEAGAAGHGITAAHIYIEAGVREDAAGLMILGLEILKELHPEWDDLRQPVMHTVPGAWPSEMYMYAYADLRKNAGIELSDKNCMLQDGTAQGKRIYAVYLKGNKPADFKPGDKVLVDQFKPQDRVDVIGISKGKGFAGVVKRQHFRGGEATRGSMFHRAPGSIGASSYPSRVVPGMRMGGHMGNARVTVRNLEVVEVDTEDNVLVVKGAVPGPNGGYVLVRRSKR